MYDQVEHWDFIEQLQPTKFPDHEDTGEDELMDEIRRLNDEQ